MKTDSDAEIPKSVFKFYSLKDCHVKAFLNHYLYLSHPSQLNDDMDACRDLLYVNDLTQETYEQLVAQICLKAPHFRTSGLSYESDSKDEYRALRESLYNVCFDFSGIISFTDSKKSFFNGTMWAHYTGEKGFAIEFDTKKLIEGMIKNPLNMQFEYPIYRGVEYVDELEALDYDKIHLIDEIGKSIAFQKTVNSNIDDSVGGYVVECIGESGSFQYTELFSTHVEKEQIVLPGNNVKIYDNVFDGGYSYHVYQSNNNYKMYILQLGKGIIYEPNIKDRSYNHLRMPKIYNMSESEFINKAEINEISVSLV